VFFCYDCIEWAHEVANTLSVDDLRNFTNK
jgi:hypothetical protein